MAEEKGLIGKLDDAVQASLAKGDAAYVAQANQFGGASAASIAEDAVKDRQEGHYLKALVEGVQADIAIQQGEQKSKETAKETAEIDTARVQGGQQAAAILEQAFKDYNAGNYKDGFKEEFEARVEVSMGQLHSGLAKVEALFKSTPTAAQEPNPSSPGHTPMVKTNDLGNKGPSR
jgi:hypothetical protein